MLETTPNTQTPVSPIPSSLKQLPIEIADFETLMNEQAVYVDKTQELYQLISQCRYYFFSRPRGFGKSLMVSALKAMFEGKRDLFKGLWIDGTDYDWKPHPVIYLDMSQIANDDEKTLNQGLIDRLSNIAYQFGIPLDNSGHAMSALCTLIPALESKYGSVCVLVDNYDQPVVDHLGDPEKAKSIHRALCDFYTIFKSESGHLKFVLLTGETVFSRSSVFSGFNNLYDISDASNYGTMLGFTQQELEASFAPWINTLAEYHQLDLSATLEKVRIWYGGYLFSDRSEQVYNPFSLLQLLNTQQFKNHWLETGIPVFFPTIFKHEKYEVQSLEEKKAQRSAFSAYEVDHISVLPMLRQLGYLTMKTYDDDSRFYTLGYPNVEVATGFLEHLLAYFTEIPRETQQYCVEQMGQALLSQNWDALFTQLNRYLAQIPYDWFLKEEYHYQHILYTLFKLTSLSISGEVHTSHDSLDILIEHQAAIYVIGCKRNQSIKVTMKQIQEGQYFEAYKGKNKPLYVIGANVTDEARGVTEWLVETLSELRTGGSVRDPGNEGTA